MAPPSRPVSSSSQTPVTPPAQSKSAPRQRKKHNGSPARKTPQRHGLDNEHDKFVPVQTVQQARQQYLVRILFGLLIVYFAFNWRLTHSRTSDMILDDSHDFNDKNWNARGESNGVTLYDYKGKKNKKRYSQKLCKYLFLKELGKCPGTESNR